VKILAGKLAPAVVLLMLAASCGSDRKGTSETAALSIGGIKIERTSAASIPVVFSAVGTVRARNSAVISARIPGNIRRIFVREGDTVRRGRVLAEIDAVETTSGAAGAGYAVEEAGRGVEQARTQKQLADVTFERYSRLYAEEAVTRQEFDTRKAERDLAEQQLARARAGLAKAREAARAAGAVAGHARIVSPINGVVASKSIDTGMTVFPGTPLFTVEEATGYRLEVNVPETFSGKVGAGRRVEVIVDGSDHHTRGTVVDVTPRVDPATRTFKVKIDLVSTGMRSGLFGHALLPVGEKTGITVPAEAVGENGQLTYVWVVDSRGIARMRLVKPGNQLEKRVEILAGLAPGESVVVGGAEKVTEGAKIR
jgi:RND family efflux transporter MFP subunit